MTFLRDLRYGLRLLWGSPGFTAVAVGTLAIGIAASATVFGWIDTILLDPLAGTRGGERLVTFESVQPDREGLNVSFPDFRDYRESLKLSTVAIANFPQAFTVGEGEHAERVWGELVSGNFFDVLDVPPLLGRFFLPDEQGDAVGSAPVAVVSERYWRGRLGADRGVVGRTIRVNRQTLTIVGVAAAPFRGSSRGLAFDMWIPLVMGSALHLVDEPLLENRRTRMWNATARLGPGVAIEQARAEVEGVAERLARLYPDTNEGFGATLLWEWDAHGGVQHFLRRPLQILLAMSLLVLLIACVNVANLLLARATGRQKEISVRLALGAGRGRVVRQLLAEAFLLPGLAALVGVPLAQWAQQAITRLAPAQIGLPVSVQTGQLSGKVLAFAVALSVVSALVAGLSPALQATRSDVSETLKEGGRGGGPGARSHRLRALFVVSEVALALVALVAAGLFIRSFRAVRAIDPGFDPRGVVVAQLRFATTGYSSEERAAFCTQLGQRLESASGVEAVSFADRIPLGFGLGPGSTLEVEGYTPARGEEMTVGRTLVAPGYFELLRNELLEGRHFTEADQLPPAEGGPEPVVIVNESFARRFFGGGHAIGRRVRRNGLWYTVIGLVRDSKVYTLSEGPRPYFFAPLRRDDVPQGVDLFVRTRLHPGAMAATIRREAVAIDPVVGAVEAMSLTDYIGAPLFPERMAAVMLGVLGAMALVLAAVGLYSVMAYAVSERTHEIGIRMAMGAGPQQMLGMVVRRGLVLAGTGVLVGVPIALVTARLVGGMLVDVSPADPWIVSGAIAFLALVALAASAIPALRASRLDPVAALRHE